MKEIDDFLPRWVTPALSPQGYRKSSHTYRKHFASGDWAVFSFRGYPLPDARGSFLADASFVPGPLFDWFNFANPGLAMKQPTGWWADWANPLNVLGGSGWAYRSDAERDICGGLLVDRLGEVCSLFDHFAGEPDLLLSLVLSRERHDFDELPLFDLHLQRAPWRAALLIRRGPSPELEQALADADAYPNLRMRQWAEHYLMARDV